MTTTQSPAKSPTKRWQTILALIFSALGFVYFLVQALFVSGLWLVSLIDPQTGLAEAVPNGLLVWASLLSALLLVPTFWISLNELRNKPAPAWLDSQRPWLRWVLLAAIVIWPLMIGLGWLVSGRPGLAVYLLGPINILVAGIPVVWVYALAQRKLQAGSIGRKWRVFGFSLTLSPVVIVLAELIVLAILGVLAVGLVIVLASINPALSQQLETLSEQLSSTQDADAILQIIEPYLRRPVVIFGLLAVMSGFVPLIEEILKPLALWSMAGRNLTDQEGFVAGLLSGAGFALMENLLYFTNVASAEDWLFMVIGRAGTGVLHMFGSGLVGLALVRAWRSGKWLHLGWMTALAVVFHGLWNALALLGGLGPSLVYEGTPTIGQEVLFYLPLILLLLIEISALVLINRRLRKDQSPSESPDLLEADESKSPKTLTTE
jgi:RsiW-degrading membrane proteinase PrsW (M82 family)